MDLLEVIIKQLFPAIAVTFGMSTSTIIGLLQGGVTHSIQNPSFNSLQQTADTASSYVNTNLQPTARTPADSSTVSVQSTSRDSCIECPTGDMPTDDLSCTRSCNPPAYWNCPPCEQIPGKHVMCPMIACRALDNRSL
jgi:hypothetical protein